MGITITLKQGRCMTGNTPGELAASPSVLKGTQDHFYCPSTQRAALPANLDPDATLLLHCTHAAKTTHTIKRLLFNCSRSSHLSINFVLNKNWNPETIKEIYSMWDYWGLFLMRNIWSISEASVLSNFYIEEIWEQYNTMFLSVTIVWSVAIES